MKELILGDVRSGKSRLAEQRAHESGFTVVYVAAATPGDDEMRNRIEEHRKRRPAGWLTIEEPRALAQPCESTLARIAASSSNALRALMVRRIGGVTGDTAGAMVELVETATLVVAALML
jgi:cobalamin synthase